MDTRFIGNLEGRATPELRADRSADPPIRRARLGYIPHVLNWSFPLFRLFAVQVRVHWFVPIFFGVELVRGLSEGWFGWAALALALLFLQILCHEYGHALTAKKLGAGAETILLWPLGGLAYCGRGRTAREDMLISFMGPVVNSLFFFAAAAALFGIGRWNWTWLNPWESWYPFAHLPGFELVPPSLQPAWYVDAPWKEVVLNGTVQTLKLGMMLTLFNLLIPAYPLDGGRILQIWLTEKYGQRRGATVSTFFSIPVGLAMIFWGLLQKDLFLMLIGAWVLLEAWQIRRLAEMGALDQHPAFADTHRPEFDVSDYYAEERPRRMGWFARWRARRKAAAHAKEARREADLSARVDEILEKVSRDGMHSLTDEERRLLEEASRRQRGE